MTAEAFKENILPLNRKLLGFANRFMQDIDDAKDIVQEIYVKLWNMRSDLDKYNSVEALAMRMTRNLCLDKIKLKKTVPLNGMISEETSEEVKVPVIVSFCAVTNCKSPLLAVLQFRV